MKKTAATVAKKAPAAGGYPVPATALQKKMAAAKKDGVAGVNRKRNGPKAR